MRLSTAANIHTFILQFNYITVLLAMAMLVRKTFTTDVGQMQWQRHCMQSSAL